MRRLFWLAMGITIGALVVRRLSKLAERLTPKGMVDTLGGALSELMYEMRDFVGDVRSSMSQREYELREGTGLQSESSVNGSSSSSATNGTRG
jgi:hypothetical protein